MTDGADSPWEQHPEESSKAFAAFAAYRNLPANTRSIDAAWRRVRSTELDPKDPEQLEEMKALPTTRAPKTWRDWSARYSWVSRVAAWDTELDRHARGQLVRDHKAMLDKHRALGAGLIAKAAEALKNMAAAELEPRDVIGAIRVGVQVERTAFELPDQIIENRHTGEVKAQVEARVEHSGDSAYDTLVRLLLEAPDAAIIAADRLAGRLAAAPSLPCTEGQPRETHTGTAP
jgi:hypothetical protein